MKDDAYFSHPTSVVSPQAQIGLGTKIWVGCQIREGVVLGDQCILSKNVYVDVGVRIGSNVKIQNNVSVYHGVTIEDGVFVGPNVCFTNDKNPRAINPDGTPKGAEDWIVSAILVKYGASIGANSTIVCGTTVGRWAMVGAGSVVTHDIPDHGLVVGIPARLVGYICSCGKKLRQVDGFLHRCEPCALDIKVSTRIDS